MGRILVSIVLGALVTAAPLHPACSASHPETLSDVFKMENVDGVQFDPQGKRVVFERVPPYLHMSTYGVQTRQTAQLYEYKLDGKSKAHPLIAKRGKGGLPEHVEGMWLGGFSPQGTRLAVYWLQDGATKAGVYDFSTGRLTIFAFTPDIQFSGDSLAWLSEEELIYTALPVGQQPPVPDWQRVAARNLAKAWEDAWHGEKSTASVLQTRRGEPDRSMPQGSLLRVNAQTGAARAIGSGRFSAFALSPDKRYLAALQLGRLRQMDPDKLVNGVNNPPGVRKQLMLFDLVQGGAAVALFPEGEPTEETLAWSPSDDRVSFCTSGTSSAIGGIYYVFDAAAGTRVAVPHVGLDITSQRERGWQDVPDQAIPFGKGIAVPARAQVDPKAAPVFTQKEVFAKGLSRVDWYEIAPDGSSRNLTAGLNDVSAALISVSKDGLYISADGGIWRIGPDGERHNLTAAFPSKLTYTRMFRAGGGESKDISAGVAVARVAGGADAPYVFVDLASGQSTTLAVAANSGRMLAVSTAAQAAVMRGTGDTAWSLSLVSSSQQQSAPFWVFNQHLKEVQAPRKISLSYSLPSGKTVQAEALLPADWTPGRRAPAVVYIYPETSHYLPGNFYGFVDTYDDAFLASLGYIVLYPYSSEMELRTEESPLGNWATLVLPAVDALVKAGYADPDRISTYGISQGSWSVLALLTQTTRFKAAMAGYGVADFVSQYGSMGIGRRMWPDDLFSLGESLRYEASAGTYPHIGIPLVDDPMRYIRASPLFAARKIQTPLLLMHTDLDVNFTMSQFDEMFQQMVRLRKEAQYVRYWGEEHGLKSPANLRDQWSRMFAWFDQWSDISRDENGRMIYELDRVKSRQGAAAKTPEDFLHLKWFFGE